MKYYLLIFPIALLVTYSQLVVKWRAAAQEDMSDVSIIAQLIKFCSDPIILSSYLAALLASFAWLFVITKLQLTIAFPVYIGVTFLMVMFGGWCFLAEDLSPTKIIAAALILSGIVLGMASSV